MYSSTILFEFRRDLGGISSKNLHYLFLDWNYNLPAEILNTKEGQS